MSAGHVATIPLLGSHEVSSRATRKCAEDTSWEPKSGIVATCPALIGSGKKIPATVKQILKSAKQCQAQAAEEDEQDRAHAGSPKSERG